jgi:GDP-L-fucose synthase
MSMSLTGKIFIAGHRGMVGSAALRHCQESGQLEPIVATRQDLNLLDQKATFDFLQSAKPDVVLIAAAKVGGIHANSTYPAEFIYENLASATNLIHGSYLAGVKRVLFLGSSCIYPKLAPQPMPEDCLLTSPLEPTNEAYAIAKIAGLKMCQHYRKQYGVMYHSLMPTNLYGPGDNYHPENSHVIPALIRRFHEAKVSQAKEVVIWGTGSPFREFLHVNDLADACFHILGMENPPDWINVGSGSEVSIKELALLIGKTVGFEGEINFDATKPDGTPRKLMDPSLLRGSGWSPKIDLEAGLKDAYRDFLNSLDQQTMRG